MYNYNRDSNIMRKLLGKGAPDSSAGDLSVSSAPTPTVAYRPLKSQSAVFHAGTPISRLDVAPDKRAVVLAGSHVLKTVLLDESNAGTSNFSFVDGLDLRAVINAQPSSGSGSGSRASAVADQMNIRDVKWHGASTIFTACANGGIFAYDLARMVSGPGSAPVAGPAPLQYVQTREDSRQVNALDINPHLKSWLLSGSQDGMARVFDVSNPMQTRSGVLTFRQRFAPLKCIDSVRQVKWSPRVGHEMAACTEAGVILKWDARQPSRPLLRINAHDKACSSIAWHPDGIHLLSAGSDSKLHIWDLGANADKRQKPKWTISTPAPVAAVAWRPGLWSATAQARRAAQVAVTYEDSGSKRYGTPVVHIWDLARPTMPYKEIEAFESSPTALSWQDQDLLWTVGQDGLFNQCDVAFASKVIDRQSTSAAAFSPRGDAVMFLDERPSPPKPRPSTTRLEPEQVPRSPYSTSPQTPMLSVSRSDSEDDVLTGFLGPKGKMQRKRTVTSKSNQSFNSTPPSATGTSDDPKQVMGLEQALRITGVFKSQQTMTSGHIPAAASVHRYQCLSSLYLDVLEKKLPSSEEEKSLVQRVTAIMEQYAKGAEAISLFRLAQTWRILSFATSLLLRRRAQYHLEMRVAQFHKVKFDDGNLKDRPKPALALPPISHSGEVTPRSPSAQSNSIDSRSLAVRSLLSEEIESTSNQPTPVARPADASDVIDFQHEPYQPGRKLSPIVEPESFTLGPALHGSFKGSPRKRHDSVPISEMSHGSEISQASSTEGYDFYDTAVMAKAIDVPAPKKLEASNWDFSGQEQSNSRAKVARQESDESFGQMFSISDGKQSAIRSAAGSLARSGPVRENSGRSDSSLDFKSRVRGERMDDSSGSQLSKQVESQGQSAESPEDLFLISQTTATSDDAYPTQMSYPSHSDSDFMPSQAKNSLSPSGHQPARDVSPSKSDMPLRYDGRPHITETDYFPWEDDPPYPHPLYTPGLEPSRSTVSSLNPYDIILKALDFESRTSPLNAAAMILLLKPLVPEALIDTLRAGSILRQHHARLMRMSLFVEAALMRKMCMKGWPEGLPDWGENYPAIFAQAQQGVKVGFFCSSCRKPREIDPSEGEAAIWTCERCRKAMAPCAVCGHRELQVSSAVPEEVSEGPEASSDIRLPGWWFCPGCSHGGHASCLQTWHAAMNSPHDPLSQFSDGCCPMDGCGHACLPGKYRGETTTARADELGRTVIETSRSRDERRASNATLGGGSTSSRRSSPHRTPPIGSGSASGSAVVGTDRSSVKSDGNDVPQSRAVGMAREALSKGGSSGSGGGILSSSPGRAVPLERTLGERERRKSVKFAKPDR